MTDKKMYKLLNEYANETALAVQNGVKVEITYSGHSYEAIDKDKVANYNDITLLSDLVKGAEHFLLWAQGKGKL